MHRSLRRLLEIVASLAIVLLLDFLTPGNFGFSQIYGLPYLLLIPLFAAFYGLREGILSLTLVSLALAVPVPFLMGEGTGYPAALLSLIGSLRVAYPLAILFAFIFGGILQIERRQNQNLRSRLKETSKANWALKRKSEALIQSNGVLENRVSGQTISMSLLYNRMNRFSNVNVVDTLEVLLETVHMFIGAEESSVWEYQSSVQQLRLLTSYGWPVGEQREAVHSVNDSIEGWVIRNSSCFSYRMLLENEFLAKLDRGRSIITVPIMLGHQPWGVLNIEALPFEHYSEYSEKVLQIIIKLAQPFIQRSFEYEQLFQKQEADEITGLPLYSQFRTVLDKELSLNKLGNASLSMIIIELANNDRLLNDFDIKEIKALLPRIIDHIRSQEDHARYYFHYKRDTQLAIISPNTDQDGISLTSLDILSFINSSNWEIRGKNVPLEVIIGHSSVQGSGSVEELVGQAENLLEMQRI